VAYHVQAADATYGANQPTRMSCSYRGFRIASSRFCMEHPRSYAFGNHRLPGASARESPEYRQGKSSAGRTSMVREPMAGEAPRFFTQLITVSCCSCRQSKATENCPLYFRLKNAVKMAIRSLFDVIQTRRRCFSNWQRTFARTLCRRFNERSD
jgi:hypothetical protein